MINSNRVAARLSSAIMALDGFKRKVYRLRRLVAGDISALEGGISGRRESRDDGAEYARPMRLQMQDIMTVDVEEVRNNGLLKAIRTLVLQTAYFFPEIEFRGLEPEEAVVNAGYVKWRMGQRPFGCDGNDHMRMALLDYAIGGLGFAYTPMWDGKPVVRFADTLDMIWDQTAKLPQDMTWAAISVCLPLHRWVRMFGPGRFKKYMAGRGNDGEQIGMDVPFELLFYYDVEDEKGNYKIFVKTGEFDIDEEPILEADSPCYFDIAGDRVPFLPFESLFFMSLPSVRLPIGIAESMLPAQLAVWRAERTIKLIIERGAGMYVGDGKTVADPKERQKVEDGEQGAIIWTEEGGNPAKAIVKIDPMDIPRILLDYRNHNEEELIEQSGANPFAVGDKVDGVNFAAQVNAIQGAAGLTAGTIAKDNAAFWERVIRKFIAKGKAYDTKPITLRIDGVELVFDQSDPISNYLRPDSEISVREDTMQFRPREQRINEAMLFLNTAAQYAQRYPAMLDYAMRDFLGALNLQSIEKMMEPPAAPAGMPGVPPGATPAAAGPPNPDAQMMTEASTAAA